MVTDGKNYSCTKEQENEDIERALDNLIFPELKEMEEFILKHEK